MSASQLPTIHGSATAETRQAAPGPDSRAPTRANPGSPPGGAPPLVLDRYRLSRRLGSGAFGTVWMARDERLDREVAVKIVPRERIVGGRFEREARAAARLSHPAIVTLYEATVDDEGAYLVSELVRGATLQALLQAGRLSDRDVVAIAISLCEALSHAHAQGVVHRDVKPSNILVPERPSSPIHPAKLTDFGVARVLGGDSLTRTGDVVGTAAYMAPEQAEGREAGAPADLYALALVTYEALTGINPVRTGTAAVRARRLGAHLPPLRRQRRDLPRELGRAIDLALRPRPRERGTLEELRESLAACLTAVEDTPGVVASAWPRGRDVPAADDPDAAPLGRGTARDDPHAFAPDLEPDSEPAIRQRLGGRILAAACAALTVGWLASQVIGASQATGGSGSTLLPAPLAAALAAAAVLMLPRVGWICVAVTMIGAALIQGQTGLALAVLLAVAVPILLLPRAGTAWPLAAGAAALGAIGLAGAWPAIAARAGTNAWRRGVLAAVGWLWLALASPLANSDLYAHRPAGTPAAGAWTTSLTVTVHDVLGRILSSGVLGGAPVWAAGAVLLPWILKRRSLAVNTAIVTVWSAVLVAATETAIGVGHGSAPVHAPRMAVVGAIVGALVALRPSLADAWRATRHANGLRPELP